MASFSTPSPTPCGSNSTSPSTKNVKAVSCTGAKECINLTIKGFIKRSDCHWQVCPEVDNHQVKVEWFYTNTPGGTKYVTDYSTDIFAPNNAGTTVQHPVGPGWGDYWGYRITTQCKPHPQADTCNDFRGTDGGPPFRYETAYIYGGTGTCASASQQKIGPHSVNTCDSATTTGTSTRETVNINYYWECIASFPNFC